MIRFTIFGAVIAVPFFLSACTNTVPTLYDNPTTKRAYVERTLPALEVSPNKIIVNGQQLQAATPESISIISLPVCEAAELVLAAGLSLSYSCSGKGEIGLEVRGGQADILFQTFRAAVERLGGSVEIENQSIHVVGTKEGRSVGVGAPMPNGMPSGEQSTTAGGSHIFTIGDLSERFERRARTTAFTSQSFVVRYMPVATDTQEIDEVAAALNLAIQSTKFGSRIYAIGTPSDISSLEPFLKLTESITVPIDVGYASEAAIEAVRTAYPLIKVSFDDKLGTIWLSGPTNDVSDAYHSVRTRIPENKDILVEAVFISSSTSDADQFKIDPSISLITGDFTLKNGLTGNTNGLSLLVDSLKSYSSVNVLSRPSLTTSSGRTSEFLSGTRVPVVSEINEEGRQSVNYEDSGITFSVTPTLLPSGLIRLDMRLEISEVVGSGVIDNPNFATRSVRTVVEVSSGDVIQLSGLQDKSNLQSNSKVLGIFPSRGSSVDSSTLSFFVTARLD
jgi:hypothetical protein